jgi:hypothetical protein
VQRLSNTILPRVASPVPGSVASLSPAVLANLDSVCTSVCVRFAPVQCDVLKRRHVPALCLTTNLGEQLLLLFHRQQLPPGEIHMLARLDDVPFDQPRSRSNMGVDRPPRFARVAIRAFVHRHGFCFRRYLGALGQRAASFCLFETWITKRMHRPPAPVFHTGLSLQLHYLCIRKWCGQLYSACWQNNSRNNPPVFDLE